MLSFPPSHLPLWEIDWMTTPLGKLSPTGWKLESALHAPVSTNPADMASVAGRLPRHHVINEITKITLVSAGDPAVLE